MARYDSLSLAQARRIALAAQGFTDPRPSGPVTTRHLRRVLSRTGLLQIDSVNVLQRAHYLPAFSRLGAYDTGLLDRAAYRRPRLLFEYWAHVASLVPVQLHPYLRWRMDAANLEAWGRMRTVAAERPDLVAWVLDEVRERGPIAAAAIEEDTAAARTDHWGWNWSDAKSALEYLFWTGQVATAGRTNGFARLYDLVERVIPAEILQAPTPSRAEAMRELTRVAAVGLGVATEPELRDYFRLPVADSKQAVADLVEEGTLRPVSVEGQRQVGYLHAEAKIPRRVRASTLVSPFDPLIWERSRTERFFGFHYRIEIYVPAAQRVHGYYVLPFLLDEALVARVDLKAERREGVLQVPSVWAEPGHATGAVGEAVAAGLRDLAGWLGLERIAAPTVGDLAGAVAGALRTGSRSSSAARSSAGATV